MTVACCWGNVLGKYLDTFQILLLFIDSTDESLITDQYMEQCMFM